MNGPVVKGIRSVNLAVMAGFVAAIHGCSIVEDVDGRGELGHDG